jgi:hypothetical protein
MRVSEIFGLRWSEVMYGEGLIAVRAKLKGGKMRYAPMPVELAAELRRFPVVIGEDRVFPPKPGTTSGRPLRTRENPRPLEYQDDRTLCEAGAAAYCADQQHGAGNVETDGATKMRQGERRLADVRVFVRATETLCFWLLLSALEGGGQGRNRTADASLFRAAYRCCQEVENSAETIDRKPVARLPF